MQTRHTVTDGPLGELTLAADGDAMTGVYFRHHWHPPAGAALGRERFPLDLEAPVPAAAGRLF